MHWKNNSVVPQSLNKELSYEPATPLLSIYLKEMKEKVNTKTYTQMPKAI
jgi:hypothetical protein